MTVKTPTASTGKSQLGLKFEPGPSQLRLTLGALFLEQRNKQGLTQAQAAELVGVHRTYVNKVERGQVNINLDNLDKFFRAFLPDGNPNAIKTRFGNNIKAWRGESHSQESLALFLDIPVQYIFRVEKGVVTTAVDQVGAIAQKLGVDPMELLK